MLMHGLVPPQVQEAALPHAELHEVPVSPPACNGPSGWQHDPLDGSTTLWCHQPLLLVWCHQQTCSEYALPNYPNHE